MFKAFLSPCSFSLNKQRKYLNIKFHLKICLLSVVHSITGSLTTNNNNKKQMYYKPFHLKGQINSKNKKSFNLLNY